MYLKKLYKHNKFWFLVIMFFIAGQLFINYKRGVVFSPFYHYGMYSEVIKPAESYIVPEIIINGDRLNTKDFSPQEWDNITLPLTEFHKQEEWNRNLFQQDIHRLLPFTDAVKFRNTIAETEFNEWYKKRLEYITGTKINSLEIRFAPYVFNGVSLSYSPNPSF